MEDIQSTQVEGLDRVLGGGIPKGHLVLVCGNPGTMKSVLCFTMMYKNALKGNRGLYISLEQDEAQLRRSMAKLAMDNTREDLVYVLDLATIRRELLEQEQDRDWTRMLLDVARQAVADGGYTLLTIDSMQAFYALANFENPRRELYHFFKEMKDLGITTFFINEVPMGARTLTPYGEDFLTDGLILLRHFETSETDVQLRIRCVKMREMRHSPGYFAVYHDGTRLVVSDVLTRRKRPAGFAEDFP